MSPPLLLSLLIAAMIGLAAHALTGRYLWQLPLFLIAAGGGVFAGEVIAALMGAGFLRYGSVFVGSAALGGILSVVALWAILTRIMARVAARSSRRH